MPERQKAEQSEAGLALDFDRGTILIRRPDLNPGEPPDTPLQGLDLPGTSYDQRVEKWRAPARYYREIVLTLRNAGVAFKDQVRDYPASEKELAQRLAQNRDDNAAEDELDLSLQIDRQPFPYQQEAVDAWWKADGRGIVVLPTGSGKTFVAQLAMIRAHRNTLVVAPTIDLMQQWYGVLASNFDIEIGLLGGGYYEPKPVTVATYDSAYLHMDRLGNRYGMVIFDECHHLPGPSYILTAEFLIAPFRLGLTATLEREDGAESLLVDAVGPTVYRQEIKSLAGEYLAEYETLKIHVRLSKDEERRYVEARGVYRDFLHANNLRLGTPHSWSRFLTLTSRSEDGRRAFLAYREQRQIAQGSEAKIRALDRLLMSHRGDRVLIFTNDNNTVYRISREFFIPAITHQTKAKERQHILEGFNGGEYPFIVTSKVLNEGVDVPAANVAIVLSGSGSVREHVQRLGRILRRAEGKHAILYEIIAENTAEEFVSKRRRRHDAYQ